MALTKLANLINPEVMADMISAELPQKLKFAPLATINNELKEKPGNTITVPKFAYIGDAQDLAEGEAVVSTVLTASTTEATVKKTAKSVKLSDESLLASYGDPIGETNKQLGMSIAAKVDSDCVEALGGATLVYDGSAAVIGYTGVVDAIDKFQEEDYEAKVLFVHPSQLTQLRKDSDFKDLNKYPLNPIMTGVIGEIAGCQVVASKRVPVDATKYTNYIVKAGALTIYMKRDVQVESDRNIEDKTNTIVADEHYVVVLSDDSKVVKATFKK